MAYIPVYYSGKPVSNIPVIVPIAFQSSSIIFQYWIPTSPRQFLWFFSSFSNFFTDACFIFPIWCLLFHSYYVHQLSDSHFSSRLFICFFWNFYRSIPLYPNFRIVFHQSAFQYLLLPYPLHLSPSYFLFPGFQFPCCVYRFFSLSFPFASGSGHWRHLRDGTRNPSIAFRHSCSSRLPAIYCQLSFTIHSIL